MVGIVGRRAVAVGRALHLRQPAKTPGRPPPPDPSAWRPATDGPPRQNAVPVPSRAGHRCRAVANWGAKLHSPGLRPPIAAGPRRPEGERAVTVVTPPPHFLQDSYCLAPRSATCRSRPVRVLPLSVPPPPSRPSAARAFVSSSLSLSLVLDCLPPWRLTRFVGSGSYRYHTGSRPGSHLGRAAGRRDRAEDVRRRLPVFRVFAVSGLG
jgi:hypothetical protein